jgi:hypothetical protein
MPGMNVKVDRVGVAQGQTVQQAFATIASEASVVRGIRFESPAPNVLVLRTGKQKGALALGLVGYIAMRAGNLTIVGSDTPSGDAEITATGTADLRVLEVLESLLAESATSG